MVNGIEAFRDYFAEYTDQYVIIGGFASDQYVIIGGFACDLLMEDAGLDFSMVCSTCKRIRLRPQIAASSFERLQKP